MEKQRVSSLKSVSEQDAVVVRNLVKVTQIDHIDHFSTRASALNSFNDYVKLGTFNS